MNIKLNAVLIFLTICLIAAGSVVGQDSKKPWKEWSKKDAQKMLSDSPWAQLQIDMDFIETSPLTRPRDPSATNRLNQGEGLTYGIRFFSARPVRQAFVRMIQLQQKNLPPETVERLNGFAEKASKDSIVIAVTIEGPDSNVLGKAMGIVWNASTPTLKPTTYLERNDGQRLFLEEYVPPGKDGFGARFVFPRTLDGKPFLTTDFTIVRFVSDLGSSMNFHMTFKVKDMLVDGQLEY
jgi:hypothetical protein